MKEQLPDIICFQEYACPKNMDIILENKKKNKKNSNTVKRNTNLAIMKGNDMKILSMNSITRLSISHIYNIIDIQDNY